MKHTLERSFLIIQCFVCGLLLLLKPVIQGQDLGDILVGVDISSLPCSFSPISFSYLPEGEHVLENSCVTLMRENDSLLIESESFPTSLDADASTMSSAMSSASDRNIHNSVSSKKRKRTSEKKKRAPLKKKPRKSEIIESDACVQQTLEEIERASKIAKKHFNTENTLKNIYLKLPLGAQQVLAQEFNNPFLITPQEAYKAFSEERRRMKNRESAADSRRKAKANVEAMQKKILEMTQETKRLLQENVDLKRDLFGAQQAIASMMINLKDISQSNPSWCEELPQGDKSKFVQTLYMALAVMQRTMRRNYSTSISSSSPTEFLLTPQEG